uniref:Uncharacterized protein n=1 Tax=Drosophila melanogaster TaxID=7227 RepID=M9PG91_DROME|nr:uncharacterized protein Dmel_CG43938 [Drosophila melanogaster]AGB94829.1 uncharacterized protein Dmel_CG43938 [Drosophila melanogaster]|eukprot:NP_001262136.1 uncharacterized protein Dmel_CG43938 [Drosophila melanogaster]
MQRLCCCQTNNETICSFVDICISQRSSGQQKKSADASTPHKNANLECAKDFAMDFAISTTSWDLNSTRGNHICEQIPRWRAML